MVSIKLDLNAQAETPLYSQIYQQLRDTILAGELPAGTRLPASRQLARDFGLARVTVTQAYDQLHTEGFVVRRRGAGTFVSENLPARPLLKRTRQPSFKEPPELSPWGQRIAAHRAAESNKRAAPADIDFTFGRPLPQIFPYDIWRRLLARYLSTDDTILSRYGSAAGFMPLRRAVADYLQRQRRVQCAPEQVIIVSGIQQAVDIVARLLLSPGSEVVVETPGYVNAYDLLRVHGARLVPLRVDDQGLPTQLLPQASDARLVFTTPANQFPHGGAMPLARRLELLHWAGQQGAYVIEDDYDGELRYRGRPIAALQGLDTGQRVIYLGSFSKVLFPALRLGYVVLPPALVTPFVEAKKLIDRGAPTLTQAAVTDFIVEGHFERHLRRLRKAYGQRRQALVGAMERHLPQDLIRHVDEPAGLHVMVYFNRPVDEAQLQQNAAAAGLALYSGAKYHLTPPQAPSFLLGFSGLNPQEIESGVSRLGDVLRAMDRRTGNAAWPARRDRSRNGAHRNDGHRNGAPPGVDRSTL